MKEMKKEGLSLFEDKPSVVSKIVFFAITKKVSHKAHFLF